MLAGREPANTGYQRDVSVSLNKLGDLAVAVGDGDRARGFLERSVASRRRIQALEPARVDLAEELGIAFHRLAAADEGQDAACRSAVLSLLEAPALRDRLTRIGESLREWVSKE